MLTALLPRGVAAETRTEIRLVADGATFSVILEDNPASRDFLRMLPLTLTMKDYNGTEKIGHPPRGLSTRDAPDGFAPSPGDVAFYAPWGNLVLFYRDFSWSRGLSLLGRMTSGAEKLAAMRGDFTATFERVE